MMTCLLYTSGSGAEVSPWAVITDDESGLKAGLGRLDGAPVLAVVDPSLTRSMPLRQTAYQGFDALFHAIETVINKNSDPMSEMYALKAVSYTNLQCENRSPPQGNTSAGSNAPAGNRLP